MNKKRYMLSQQQKIDKEILRLQKNTTRINDNEKNVYTITFKDVSALVLTDKKIIEEIIEEIKQISIILQIQTIPKYEKMKNKRHHHTTTRSKHTKITCSTDNDDLWEEIRKRLK